VEYRAALLDQVEKMLDQQQVEVELGEPGMDQDPVELEIVLEPGHYEQQNR
jgi:hypothetical protein